MYSEHEYMGLQDIMIWANKTQAHGKYENFEKLTEGYWTEMLNTSASIDSMWCDGDSSPLTDWDFVSPQPEVALWDSN